MLCDWEDAGNADPATIQTIGRVMRESCTDVLNWVIWQNVQ
jgi:hypothetical protein